MMIEWSLCVCFCLCPFYQQHSEFTKCIITWLVCANCDCKWPVSRLGFGFVCLQTQNPNFYIPKKGYNFIVTTTIHVSMLFQTSVVGRVSSFSSYPSGARVNPHPPVGGSVHRIGCIFSSTSWPCINQHYTIGGHSVDRMGCIFSSASQPWVNQHCTALNIF
jgi:hypothetical protein